MFSLEWAHIFTTTLKFTANKKAVGCVLSTFVVGGDGGGWVGMMSLPVWSHVLSRGIMSLLVWSHVSSRGYLVPEGVSGPGGSGPGGVLVSGGLVLGRVWSKGNMTLPLTVNRPSCNFVGRR